MLKRNLFLHLHQTKLLTQNHNHYLNGYKTYVLADDYNVAWFDV